MSKEKSLGQIAYEAVSEPNWCPYDRLQPEAKEVNEKMAKAVAERCAYEASSHGSIGGGEYGLACKHIAEAIRSLVNGGSNG